MSFSLSLLHPHNYNCGKSINRIILLKETEHITYMLFKMFFLNQYWMVSKSAVCIWYLQHGSILKDVLFVTHHAVLVERGDPLLWVLHYLLGGKAQWCCQLSHPPEALPYKEIKKDTFGSRIITILYCSYDLLGDPSTTMHCWPTPCPCQLPAGTYILRSNLH